jgi:hypothetical protein
MGGPSEANISAKPKQAGSIAWISEAHEHGQGAGRVEPATGQGAAPPHGLARGRPAHRTSGRNSRQTSSAGGLLECLGSADSVACAWDRAQSGQGGCPHPCETGRSGGLPDRRRGFTCRSHNRHRRRGRSDNNAAAGPAGLSARDHKWIGEAMEIRPRLARSTRRALIALVRLYQLAISPLLPPACRFWPTCSHYAAEAIDRHGALHGAWMTVRRIIRCHPLCRGGFDPVP